MAFLGSTELIGLEHNQALDDLPETNSNFCTVKVNDSVLIYTGGLGSSFVISKAMYMKGSLGQDWIRDQDMWQADRDRKTFNDKIFKLSCPNGIGSCHWTEVPKKLKHFRTSHVAMLIPKNLTFCSTPSSND